MSKQLPAAMFSVMKPTWQQPHSPAALHELKPKCVTEHCCVIRLNASGVQSVLCTNKYIYLCAAQGILSCQAAIYQPAWNRASSHNWGKQFLQ